MGRPRLLIVDACILIDFASVDVTLVTLASRHVGEVYVATPVFEEVKEIDPAMAASLGIKLFEPSLDLAAAAAAKRGRLSFQDRLCLAMAKEVGGTCVSNDKQLRSHCKAESVSVLWGLELVALIVEAGALTPEAACDVAKQIAASNSRIGRDVLARFFARVGGDNHRDG